MLPTIRHHVRIRRAQLREQGFHPTRISVPDVRSPAFKNEAYRQSQAVTRAKDESEVLDLLEEIQDFGDEP